MTMLFLLSVFWGHAEHAFAQSNAVTIGIFNFPPFYTKNRYSQAEGILVDYANQALKEGGLVAKYEISSAALLIERLGKGEIDAGMLIRHPALLDKAFYSKKPINQIQLVAYRYDTAPALSRLEDLAGKRVLTIAGYGYGGTLKKLSKEGIEPTYITARNIEQAFVMLAARRADYFLTYLKPAEAFRKNKTTAQSTQELTADPLSSFNVHWVVSKASENAEMIMKNLGDF
ncbi:MAG: substrate-binding periplasmic protein [Terasakiella sp.]|uniref:substrate-binding periplasmic protein n=1 Tax=unclassified Terasakiella TaxID=2614952 RepID=UPI003B000B90